MGIDKGSVQKIGIRSTRLRALGGEELVIPNRDITSARIGNFRKIQERRLVVKIGVKNTTSAKVLRKIPDLIRQALEKVENLKVERVHWVSFGASELGFEIGYLIKSGDYDLYMNTQQNANLAIKELFEKEKIEFA